MSPVPAALRPETPPVELAQLRGEVASTRRLVRLLQGQSRAAVRALARFDDYLVDLEQRLNSTAEEAQHGTETEDADR